MARRAGQRQRFVAVRGFDRDDAVNDYHAPIIAHGRQGFGSARRLTLAEFWNVAEQQAESTDAYFSPGENFGDARFVIQGGLRDDA